MSIAQDIQYRTKLEAVLRHQGRRYADIAWAIGVEQSAIYRWAEGSRRPKAANVRKLAEVLGVSEDELVGKPDVAVEAAS